MTVGELLAHIDRDETIIFKLNFQIMSYDTLLKFKDKRVLSIDITSGLKQFEVADIDSENLDDLFNFINIHSIPKETYRAVVYFNIIV